MLTESDRSQKLQKFQCRRCNLCCQQPGCVNITVEESENIAQFLNVDPYVFVNEYCEVYDRRKLVLKKNEDESCVFLTPEGCSIYEARPGQCRDFPVKWRTLRSFEYCEGLKELFV